MRIDAHQHFWKISRGDYGWLTPEVGCIYRDCLPDDLHPKLARNHIDKTVLVQAAPTLEETRFILELANHCDFVAAVVGWVDMEAANAPDIISSLAEQPKLVGLRPMFQDVADPDWMLSQSLAPAFEAMLEHKLKLDALVLPHHLANLLELLCRYPDMDCVIDHCAKPRIAYGEIDQWADDMRNLASNTRAFCKLSGLLTETGGKSDAHILIPYADTILKAFGPEWVMWGSDWPVLEMNSDYDSWCKISAQLASGYNKVEIDSIFGGTACRFYGI